MADPMTNVEIEDVLSSIRRLVADGGATAPAAPRVPKLVLTPAQRIDPVDPQAAASAVAQPDDAGDVSAEEAPASAPARSTDRVRLLATIAELEAAVRTQGDEWEPDGTGTTLDLDWSRAGFGVTEAQDAPRAAAAPQEPAAWPATLVEAARRYGDPAEGEAPGDVATFRHHRMPPPMGAAYQPRPVAVGTHDAPHAPSATTNDTAADATDAAAFEDDLIGGPDLGPDPEDALHAYLDGQPLFDVESLQTMIRAIVREELQGQLGVKITRNVRKLVRSEIHRVLTTERFD